MLLSISRYILVYPIAVAITIVVYLIIRSIRIIGQIRTVKRKTSNAVTTTTTWKKNSPGKRTTTRSYVAGGNRISYNLSTGKTKLW